MKHRTIALLSLIALLLSPALNTPGEATFTAKEKQAIAQIKAYNTAFKAIAREITPSVVTINVTLKIEDQSRPRIRAFPFEFEFEERANPRNRAPRMPNPQSTGSGIVITADGYILTNHHVAGDAEKLTVTFSDNREYDAELVGSDPRTDIAVIKVDATALKPAPIGTSDNVEIGEWVLAVGAPLNLKSTVTAGIVSAVGRDINIINDAQGLSIEDFIQTDAAIKTGNSGGALVNLNGEVIGVNTAIVTQSNRSFTGYGFAVPIDLAKKVMDDILAHGHVRRGYIGISLGAVDAGTAEAFGLDRPKGVLINSVLANTPAAKANLKAGDIILSVEGQRVNRPNHLQSLVARKHPGDTVTLAVRRNTQTLTIRVTLGERLPENLTRADDAPSEKEDLSVSAIGLTVHDLTAKTIAEYGIAKNTAGVVITHVSGEARNAGFSEGDIIYGVRQSPFQQEIKTVHDFETAISKLKKGKNAAFSVISRDGNRRFLSLKI